VFREKSIMLPRNDYVFGAMGFKLADIA